MLYQSDTDILFPARVIPSLRNLRGEEWQQLIDYLTTIPADDPEILGFLLMMVQLDGCLTCHADSYRAMQGCTLCAQQAISRFKGTDHELIKKWERARAEVITWLNAGGTVAAEY